MYAVFQTGGKQYCVTEGKVIRVEQIKYPVGGYVEFDQVLFIKDHKSCIKIGNPFLGCVKVVAQVVAHCLDRKIKIIKFHRRKHFRKCQGHRQRFTAIKIINIGVIT